MTSLEVVDLTPRFLAFYEAAIEQNLEPDARWELWQKMYGFAAVPPTPEGQQMARQLLDAAWDRYPMVLERIKAGPDGIEPSPGPVFERVLQVLDYHGPITVVLVVFVGGLEDNAFMFRDGDKMMVCIPVEQEPEKRALFLPHELAHAVHFTKAQLSGGWERSIATTVLTEGVAMHTAAQVEPGHPVEAYVEHSPGWWQACNDKKSEILQGIRGYLADSASEIVHRFTIGKGPAGLEREAYAAGWWVVEWLMEQGVGLSGMASYPEERHVEVVSAALDGLTHTTGSTTWRCIMP